VLLHPGMATELQQHFSPTIFFSMTITTVKSTTAYSITTFIHFFGSP